MYTTVEDLMAKQDEIFVEILENILDDLEMIEKVKEFNKSRKTMIESKFKVHEENFNAILHCDAWSNNFMFR